MKGLNPQIQDPAERKAAGRVHVLKKTELPPKQEEKPVQAQPVRKKAKK